MFLGILINLLIVLFSIVAVVLIKSLKSYKTSFIIFENSSESIKGIASVAHENSSNKVSDCFEGAEISLRSARVNDFDIDVFFDSIRK